MRTLIVVVLSIFLVTSIVLVVNGVEILGVNIGWVMAGTVVAYLVFSFGTKKLDEVAMIAFLDKPIQNLDNGLYFAPAFFYSVRKEAGTIFEDELPADPEKIFRDDGKIPEGMFPPIRIKFGQPRDDDDEALKKDPYNRAMVAEVVPAVRWQITDAIKFFGSIGSVANCRKNMEDLAVSIFNIEFANETPARASRRFEEVSNKLLEQIRKATATWGITVVGVSIKPFVFAHSLNAAVVGVSTAQQNALAKVHEAEGEAAATRTVATAAADAVRIAAEAEKTRLIQTGLARKDPANGEITELLPDADTRVRAEAVKALAGVKGTLVLGDTDVMLGIDKSKGGGR